MIRTAGILTLLLSAFVALGDFPEEAYNHWAWEPIVKPAIPDQTIPHWDHPIDRFVSRKLHEAGITPNKPASRKVLLRRAKIDLLGLPPTYEEMEQFANGKQLFKELIQGYLKQPAYGERWGRHWLDVARYSDTKGNVFGTKAPEFPFSYTYRDYVINAFNRDLPFNRFIKEQIAADQLTNRGSDADLAALGLLTVGDQFNGRKNLIIDDQIDVVTRGFMGLTVACSRCHDHKYDPVPIADYYSLYGVFASTHVPGELPIIGQAKDPAAYQKYVKEREKLLESLAQELAKLGKVARADVRAKNADYLQRAFNANYKKEALALRRGQVKRWTTTLRKPPASLKPTLGPAAMVFKKRSGNTQKIVNDYLSKSKPNPILAQRLKAGTIKTPQDVLRITGDTLTEAWKQWEEASKQTPKPEKLADPNWEAIRQVLLADNGPIPQSDEQVKSILGQSENDKVRNKKTAVDKHEATSRGAPPRAMVVNDGKIVEPVIFKRGDPNNRGDKVPRQFLSLLEAKKPKPFTQGSGRLELAEAIATPDNPLTARTIVNRVWHWHFGSGLVRTVDNFGILGEKPSHPELLDYLATAFIRNNWSIKWLHEHIMTSRTYKQASTQRADVATKDPENRLWWRFPRKRVEFEVLRDSLLATSGSLNHTRGGHAYNMHKKPFVTRRTVYAFVDRGNLAYELPIFDFASPSACMGIRPHTTVPQQALYMLNGEFVIAQAKQLQRAPETQAVKAGKPRITYLFRRILARDPLPAEMERSLAFVRNTPKDTAPGAYVQLIQALFSSNEFAFTD